MSTQPRVLKKIALEGGDEIVLLDWTDQDQKFVNLKRISPDGSTVWTASPFHPLEGVWTYAELQEGRLRAYNYAGFSDVIDCDTGRIIQGTFVK